MQWAQVTPRRCLRKCSSSLQSCHAKLAAYFSVHQSLGFAVGTAAAGDPGIWRQVLAPGFLTHSHEKQLGTVVCVCAYDKLPVVYALLPTTPCTTIHAAFSDITTANTLRAARFASIAQVLVQVQRRLWQHVDIPLPRPCPPPSHFCCMRSAVSYFVTVLVSGKPRRAA